MPFNHVFEVYQGLFCLPLAAKRWTGDEVDLALINSRKQCKCCHPKKKTKKKNSTGRYLRGLRNQNGEHLLNLCKSNILETQVIFSIVN